MTLDQSDYMAHLETVLRVADGDPSESIRPESSETSRLAAAVPENLAASSSELQLKEVIATGGMGVVRAATQHDLHREVAVKTVRPDKGGEVAHLLLRQEAFVTGGLEHPNILPIYGMGQDSEGGPLIVMKRVEGHSWLDVLGDPELAGRRAGDDLLHWHLGVFMQVCSAVHFAHSHNILHRDIKPSNVMIGAYDEVYLLDWGVAAQLPGGQAAHLPRPEARGSIAGTPHYMAPEMTIGEADKLTAKTDVYLLGGTLYHVLCGAPPHPGKTLAAALFMAHASHEPEFAADVPPQLAAICRRAMCAEPEERFQDAEALRHAVAEFRHNRTSIALAEEAQLSLDSSGEADEAGSKRFLAEAHFGFRHALRVWDDNVPARRGLLATLERMFEDHYVDENAAGCRVVLEEMAQRSPIDTAFAARLAELEAKLLERESELHRLRDFERESDIRGSVRNRFRAAVLACALWTAAPLVAKFMHEHTSMKTTAASFAQQGVLVFFSMLVIIWLVRHKVFDNRANRRVSAMIMALCVYIPLFRFYGWLADLSPFLTWSLEMSGYAVAFAGVALLTDYRILLAAAVYAVASGVGAVVPHRIFEINAVANGLAIAWLAWTWIAKPPKSDAIQGL